MLPVKNRFPNCDFRGGNTDITTFGFVTDIYIYIYTYIYTGDRRFSGNLWKSATSSPPELKEIETWQTTHFEDK